MSSAAIRAYRFQTKDQWSQCLLYRLDPQPDGSLLPAARLGSYAYRVQGTPAGTLGHPMAVDPYGQPFLLADPSGLLAQSRRLIVDREWVWSFPTGGTTVQRSDRESLQLDLELDVQMAVRDIASDGREGIWILCGEEILYIVRYDCVGRLCEHFRVPYEGETATQMVGINQGLSLALLSKHGTRLAVVEGASGATQRTVDLTQLAPAWAVTQFTSDGRTRIVLWGMQGTSEIKIPLLFFLDATGDVAEGPLTGLFDQPEGAKPPQSLDSIRVAVYKQTVWFDTDAGLWRLDTTNAAGPRESDSSLLTPVLFSPAKSTERGWLRAEISTDLDQGAALEVQVATTDDATVPGKVAAVSSDPSLSWTEKLEKIWTAFGFDPQGPTPFSIPGPATSDVPIAFPLLEPENQWAIVRISVITPPGTPPSPLRELRVLYPNLSIGDYLPAIFRGENDASGTLRKLVGVLESTTQQFDERIRSAASYLDAQATPIDWLDYLGRWLGLPWDDALPPDAKRRILEGAGVLLEQRGTRAGLLSLLRCVLGNGVKIELVDLTVDHAPIRVGGCGQSSGVLPALLPGISLRTPTLGEKAVLGRARLCSDGNPLAAIIPTLRIRITAPQKQRQAFEDLVQRVLLQYVPAGVTLLIRWTAAEMASPDVIGENGILLDDFHLGVLGEDSAIGHSLIGGRDRGRIGDAGFAMGLLQ
jgi:phage tail-like protein